MSGLGYRGLVVRVWVLGVGFGVLAVGVESSEALGQLFG